MYKKIGRSRFGGRDELGCGGFHWFSAGATVLVFAGNNLLALTLLLLYRLRCLCLIFVKRTSAITAIVVAAWVDAAAFHADS